MSPTSRSGAFEGGEVAARRFPHGKQGGFTPERVTIETDAGLTARRHAFTNYVGTVACVPEAAGDRE